MYLGMQTLGTQNICYSFKQLEEKKLNITSKPVLKQCFGHDIDWHTIKDKVTKCLKHEEKCETRAK